MGCRIKFLILHLTFFKCFMNTSEFLATHKILCPYYQILFFFHLFIQFSFNRAYPIFCIMLLKIILFQLLFKNFFRLLIFSDTRIHLVLTCNRLLNLVHVCVGNSCECIFLYLHVCAFVCMRADVLRRCGCRREAKWWRCMRLAALFMLQCCHISSNIYCTVYYVLLPRFLLYVLPQSLFLL